MTPSTFTVTNLLDVNASLVPIKNSLRWAIEQSNDRPGADTIVFKPGLKGTLQLGGGQITISDSVLVDGPGAGNLTVDAGQSSPIFVVSDSDGDVTRQVTIRDMTLAHGENAFVGGALLNFETLKLRNLVFKENRAGGGGAVYSEGELAISGCVFAGNFAGLPTAGGGAVYSTGAALSATRTRFVGNTATGHGGAILADNGNVTLTHCVVAGNKAGDAGGGLSNILAPGTGNLTLRRTRVSGNVAGGDGVYRDPSASDAVRVKSSIIAQNFVAFGGTDPDVSGAFTSLGFNLIGDPTGSTGFGGTGDILGTAADPRDPRLGPLADNGGRTLTHALLPGSPAIDQGDNADAPGKDQRGVRRARDGDGRGGSNVDIGAFEK